LKPNNDRNSIKQRHDSKRSYGTQIASLIEDHELKWNTHLQKHPLLYSRIQEERKPGRESGSPKHTGAHKRFKPD